MQQYDPPPYAPPPYNPPAHGSTTPAYAPQPPAPPMAAYRHPIQCPECGQYTTSLKRYTYLSYLLFVWFFAFWGPKRHTACPSCMQRDLLIKLAINLPLANVLWPFVILPWYSILFALTFTDGHSSGVQPAPMQPQPPHGY